MACYLACGATIACYLLGIAGHPKLYMYLATSLLILAILMFARYYYIYAGYYTKYIIRSFVVLES
jgi:hypothetical protein